MEKCYFVLRQRHYLPPTPPSSQASGSSTPWTGPICLGHLIPSLNHLDNVINRSHGPLPHGPDCPVYTSTSWDLDFNKHDAREASGGVEAKAPIDVTVPGVDLQGDVSAAFKNSVGNHAQFERVDTLIFQPTRRYIEGVLEDEEVVEFLKDRSRLGGRKWCLYMISGIAVARGGEGRLQEDRKVGVEASLGVVADSVAGTRLGGTVQGVHGQEQGFKRASDFVWAVRLTKIEKSLFSEHWKQETFVKGATYGLKQDEEGIEDVGDVLKKEGLEEAVVYQDCDGEDYFVSAR